MRMMMIFALAFGLSTAGIAQEAVPDLKGLWTTTFTSVIFGTNPHHPGAETVAEPPRVRQIVFNFDVEGQDGRVAWGRSWSNPASKEPFAWAIAEDGKTGLGADTDGSFRLTVLSPDRLELCYAHGALSPSKSIVATCGVMERAK